MCPRFDTHLLPGFFSWWFHSLRLLLLLCMEKIGVGSGALEQDDEVELSYIPVDDAVIYLLCCGFWLIESTCIVASD